MKHQTAVRLVLGIGLLGASAPAVAQMGSGWTEYMPDRKVQIRGCASHSASGGVDTFSVTCGAAAGDNRAEARVGDDYSSGTRQFQGEVRVVSLGGTNISLKQTFMADNGAFLMIGVTSEGRLYSVGDTNADLATGVIGKWVRINTLHDVNTGVIQIFADGALKFTKTGGRKVNWYDKYGSYRLGSGHGPIVVEWKNVHFWKDGKLADNTTTPPPSDAGATEPTPDAGPVVEEPDAATGAGGASGDGGATGGGGATGTGGSGGNQSGGSTGAGGSQATGGSHATGGAGGAKNPRPPTGGDEGGDEPPSDDSQARAQKSGCAYAPVGGPRGGLLIVLAFLLLAAAARLQLRRRTAKSSPPRR